MSQHLLSSVPKIVVAVFILNTVPQPAVTLSGYGHECDPDSFKLNLECDLKKNLFCHRKIRTCRCIEPFRLEQIMTYSYGPGVPYVPYALTEQCVLDPTDLYRKCAQLHQKSTHKNTTICKLDSECMYKALGFWSKCNLETCTCDCGSKTPQNGDRPDWNVNGECVRQVSLGEICKGNQSCAFLVSKGTPAFCYEKRHKSGLIISTICDCDPTTHIRVGTNCARKLRWLGRDLCEHNEQCKELDKHAACVPSHFDSIGFVKNVVVNVCQCVNGTVLYGGQCDYLPKIDTESTTSPTLKLQPFREPDHEDGPEDVNPVPFNWLKLAVTISGAAVFILVVASVVFLAYSKWKRVRHAWDVERHELQVAAAAKQPLLTSLGEMGVSLEVPEIEIEIDQTTVLGSGRSGIVYRGYFKPKSIHVALKTNKEFVTSEMYLRTIVEEAKVLIHLAGHSNVVQFYGVCRTIDRGNVYLICELCPLGSLETFLRTNRHLFQVWPGGHSGSVTAADTQTKLSLAHLYNWAYQIASAMEFVSRRKVIHSDLAARNVLLASIDCVKLTDFGLSRRLYDTYTYMKTEPEPLPWKWLDYDALRFMIFTTHTDVWSYGITLWEIWTLGDVPYPGILSPQCQSFMSRLLEGLHPPKPENATEDVYELMVKCWNTSPTERPSFSWIKDELVAQMKRRGYPNNGQREPQDMNGMGNEPDESGYLKPLKCDVKLTSSVQENSLTYQSNVLHVIFG